jgi:hypothetical protein
MSLIATVHQVKTASKKAALNSTLSLLAVAPLLFLSTAAAHAQTGVSALLPSPTQTVSTVPKNGDTNPYGVAFVPQNFVAKGLLAPGDLLVSNFNNKAGMQGEGTTIVNISPAGVQSLFYQGKGLGLTTGLAVLSAGYVMVANTPTTDGTCATLKPGSLLFINVAGQVVFTYTNAELIDEPWDATVFDQGNTFTVFVSNAGTGEVSRIVFTVSATKGIQFSSGEIVASGYKHSCTASDFIVANTGLAYDGLDDVLYVASTGDNAIFGILGALTNGSNAGRGAAIYNDGAHLHGPNALILAPNGHLIAGNSDFVNVNPAEPSEYVEFTTFGQFVKQLSIDPSVGGSFGVGAAGFGTTVRFAAVDDNQNQINIWTLPTSLNY